MVKALISFTRKYASASPLLIAPLAHLMFASIHPFQDGNGRIARLLHSWILLKKNLPLFAYDPDKRNQYFNHLEEARNTDAWEFIKFCNTEHKKIIQKYVETNHR
jgi:Fic family protein